MNTLKELLVEMNKTYNFVEGIGSMMTNGINTWSARIDHTKRMIQDNDFKYSKFGAIFDKSEHFTYDESNIEHLEQQFKELMKNPEEIKEILNLDIKGIFLQIFEKNNFVEQWNNLNSDEKESFLYYDKEIYKILRIKLEPKDFEFLFVQEFDLEKSCPTNIREWINAPADSKVIFYKLRKAAKDTVYENFFNNTNTQNAESHPSGIREQIALDYLKKNIKPLEYDISWYDRLDLIHDRKSIPLSYTYSFFKKLENEFNGYDKLIEKAQIPDILKKWAGMPMDKEKCQKEYELYLAEIKSKGINPFKDYEKVREIEKKYPTIEYVASLAKSLDKKEFLALKSESQGTEFEAFFNNPITEEMCKEMPYKRIDYVFTYFRDEFRKQTIKKLRM